MINPNCTQDLNKIIFINKSYFTFSQSVTVYLPEAIINFDYFCITNMIASFLAIIPFQKRLF